MIIYVIIGILSVLVTGASVYILDLTDKRAREDEKRKSLEESAKDANKEATIKAKRATNNIDTIAKWMRKYTTSNK